MKLNKLALITGVFAVALSSQAMAADPSTGTVQFIGNVVNTPCNLTNKDVLVDFGDLSVTSLNAAAEEKPFSIQLTGCKIDGFVVQGTTKISDMKIKFSGAYTMNDDKTMINAGPTNVGLSIKNGKNIVKFDEATSIWSQINKGAADNTIKFTAVAQKYESGTDVIAGTFDVTTKFEITYE